MRKLNASILLDRRRCCSAAWWCRRWPPARWRAAWCGRSARWTKAPGASARATWTSRSWSSTGDELEGLADQFNRMTGSCASRMRGWSARSSSARPRCTEALDYQTAISEVLRVISESPTDVTPVFEAIMDSARRLFGTGDRRGVPLRRAAGAPGRHARLVGRGAGGRAPALSRRRRTRPCSAAGSSCPGRRRPSTTRAPTRLRPDHGAGGPVAPHDRRADAQGRRRRSASIVVAWPEPGETPQRQRDLLQDLRRPGGDRDRERAPVQRDARGAGAADRDRRDSARSSAVRRPTCNRCWRPWPSAPALLCRAEGSRVWLPEGDHLRAMTNYGRSYESIAQARVAADAAARSIGGRAFVERRCRARRGRAVADRLGVPRCAGTAGALRLPHRAGCADAARRQCRSA